VSDDVTTSFSEHLTDEHIERVDRFRPSTDTAVLTMMFTDMAGSKRLRDRLGDAQFQRVWDRMMDSLRAIICGDQSGQIIHGTGDGVLAVFADPSTAVRRALDIQHAFRSDPLVSLRVGVDEGQVYQIINGGVRKDVIGSHVDAAARVQAMAQPGHICVTTRVKDDAKSFVVSCSWRHWGYRVVKEGEREIEIWEPYDANITAAMDAPGGRIVERCGSPPAEPAAWWHTGADSLIAFGFSPSFVTAWLDRLAIAVPELAGKLRWSTAEPSSANGSAEPGKAPGFFLPWRESPHVSYHPGVSKEMAQALAAPWPGSDRVTYWTDVRKEKIDWRTAGVAANIEGVLPPSGWPQEEIAGSYAADDWPARVNVAFLHRGRPWPLTRLAPVPLRSPLNAALDPGRPVLKWGGLRNASTYQVEVFEVDWDPPRETGLRYAPGRVLWEGETGTTEATLPAHVLIPGQWHTWTLWAYRGRNVMGVDVSLFKWLPEQTQGQVSLLHRLLADREFSADWLLVCGLGFEELGLHHDARRCYARACQEALTAASASDRYQLSSLRIGYGIGAGP